MKYALLLSEKMEKHIKITFSPGWVGGKYGGKDVI